MTRSALQVGDAASDSSDMSAHPAPAAPAALGLPVDLGGRPDAPAAHLADLACRVFDVPLAAVVLPGDPAPLDGLELLLATTAAADDLVVVSVPRLFAGVPLRSPSGSLLGLLCLVDLRPRDLDAAQRDVLRSLARAVEHELLVRGELDQAGDVQRSLLPRTVPQVPGFGLAAACVPARQVGGDLYDWYPLPDGAGWSLADVMGKGTGAALLAATVRAVLRGAVRRLDPAEAVQHAGLVLDDELGETGTLVSLHHARLEAATATLTYVDAGHGLTLHVRADGTSRRLSGRAGPLGAPFVGPWEQQQVHLAPGDTVVCFSDGVLELFGESLAGLADLERLVRRCGSADETVGRLADAAREAGLHDDATVVVVRRDG